MNELAWLWVARHGQSAGNVAAQRAEAAGAETVDLPVSGADVRLTETGRAQAAAIGQWMAGLPDRERPQLVVSSPYRRALETAELAVAAAAESLGIPHVSRPTSPATGSAAGVAAGLAMGSGPGSPAGSIAPQLRVDDRLRDREQGVLDLLTRRGLAARLPEEAERKRRLGKFHYRPPGGESWTDMAMRLRAVLDELRGERPGQRVLLVAHESVIFLFRYIIERLSQEQMLDLVGSTSLGNASLSSWRCCDGRLRPDGFNSADHLRVQGAPLTQQEKVAAHQSPSART
ncbi:MAG TPA: histidine phosphatase family protein [Rugosimonospora sp.]